MTLAKNFILTSLFKNPFSLNFETDSYLICVHLGNEMRGQLVISASIFLIINIFTRTPIWLADFLEEKVE